MKAIRRRETVGPDGRLVVDRLRVAEGTSVEVIGLVSEESPAPDLEALLVASERSLDFWDNPIDEETWSDAIPGIGTAPTTGTAIG